MGYTLSFDASCKVKSGGVGGYLAHAARDVDRKNGIEVRHSNQQIDSSKTQNNITAVYGSDGSSVVYGSAAEIREVLEERLEHVKQPMRKDAVVLRPLLLQLDPEWYKIHQSEEERAKVAQDMTDWAIDRFGCENIVFVSRHQDETNEHLHIGFTPVTKDGRLSQKDWFSSPAALREMHDDFRQHMTERGYDIDFSRRKPGKHAKRLKESEYKDFADLKKERERLAAQKQEQDARERALEARERAAAIREVQNAADAEMLSDGLKMASEAIKGAAGWEKQEAYRKSIAYRQRELASMQLRGSSEQSEPGYGF